MRAIGRCAYICLILWIGVGLGQSPLSGQCVWQTKGIASQGFPPIHATPSCSHQNTGRISLSSFSGDLSAFTFSLDNQHFQQQPVFEDLAPGDYTVYINDSLGCQVSRKASVPETAPLTIFTNDRMYPCGADSLVLNISSDGLQYLSYRWQDGSSDSVMTIFQPGIYWVEVDNGCESDLFEIMVASEHPRLESPIYMPNAFSPNADGYNDMYRGYQASGVKVITYELQIFSRTGDRVFVSRDIDQVWNGTHQEEDLPVDSYFWYLRANVLSCGKSKDVLLNGSVALLR